MKIVAIIVTYNGMEWYQRCFDSLKNSSLPIDIIVIDNRSADNTIDYIKTNYPEIKLVESSENLGFGKANNLGFKYAVEQNADFVFLLNQDAWVKYDTIEKLIEKIGEFPEYGILSPIHLDGTEQNIDSSFLEYIQPRTCPHLISDYMMHGNANDKIYPVDFVNAALWLISRKCLNTVGGFSPVFPHYGEDTNYVDRTHYHGYKIGVYPKTFGVHSRQDRVRKLDTISKKAYYKHIDCLAILMDIRRPFSRSLAKVLRLLFEAALTAFISFSFKDFMSNLLVMYKILSNLSSLFKNRRMSEVKQLCFLN